MIAHLEKGREQKVSVGQYGLTIQKSLSRHIPFKLVGATKIERNVVAHPTKGVSLQSAVSTW